MPNPKRRHSKRRTSTRRAHDALTIPQLAECPNCHEKIRAHRACPKCGKYKGPKSSKSSKHRTFHHPRMHGAA